MASQPKPSAESDDESKLLETIGRLFNVTIFLSFFVVSLLAYILVFTQPKPWMSAWWDRLTAPQPEVAVVSEPEAAPSGTPPTWTAPSIDAVSDPKQKEQLKYGKDLIAHTSKYFGPAGIIEKNRTNGLNCQNCHLEAGTKVFGNNYSAVASTYPKFRARSGGIENVYKRVNDCVERSLNGRALDTASPEMQAMVAYIQFVGSNVPKGETPEGSGLKKPAFLNRPADPIKGKIVYEAQCQTCHQADGQGLKTKGAAEFTYPPLWGKLSYNDGAGLYRMSNFAGYVKYNMPLGARHDAPILTDEEAWDVAAYVNSQPRPKKNISQDWPDITKKPFDHPFGPFADGFSEKEHKYGPFGPIKAKLEAMSPKK
ncbi:MAG: c-type cytochrome [Schleiferiaceae bacterium]